MRKKKTKIIIGILIFIALVIEYILFFKILDKMCGNKTDIIENSSCVEIEAAPEAESEQKGEEAGTSPYAEITVTATAYCPCPQCCGTYAFDRPKDKNGNTIVYTASGTIATAGRTLAVDPSIFPYGTEIIINGHSYFAEDCGGAIKQNKIDVYCNTHEEALNFGRQQLTVYVKGE